MLECIQGVIAVYGPSIFLACDKMSDVLMNEIMDE
jgi:hypothetical protein